MTRKVNAREAADDIRRGMADPEMIEKYGLSSAELKGLHKALKVTKLFGRKTKDRGAPEGAQRTCPSCGKLLPFDHLQAGQRERPGTSISALPGRVETWTRKPFVLVTSGAVAGALIIFLMTAVGFPIIKSAPLTSLTTQSQDTNESAQALANIADLKSRIDQKESMIKNLQRKGVDDQKQLTALQRERDHAQEAQRIEKQERVDALREKNQTERQLSAKIEKLEKEKKDLHAKLNAVTLKMRLKNEEDIANKARKPGDLLTLARAGNSVAQYRVGLAYYKGRDGFRNDPSAGEYWFERAAERGHPEAQKWKNQLDNSR